MASPPIRPVAVTGLVGENEARLILSSYCSNLDAPAENGMYYSPAFHMTVQRWGDAVHPMACLRLQREDALR